MSLTDDLVIRELADLAGRAAPPMALVPASVVSAGRRRRRRLAGARVALVAGLGAVAAAVATAALQPPEATPPAAATTDLGGGLVATAADAAEVVSADGDDMLALTDPAGRRYTARFDIAEGMVVLGAGAAVPAASDDDVVGFGASSDASDEGDGILQASGRIGDAFLVAGYVSGPGDVRLEWSTAGGTGSVDLPTFAVPGAAGRVYVVRIDGTLSDAGSPTAAVVHDGTIAHRAEIDLSPLHVTATGTEELAPGVVAVRTPTPIALEDGTAAVDLGIRASTSPGAAWPLALVPLTGPEVAEAVTAGGAVEGADAGVRIIALGAPEAARLDVPWTWSSADARADEDQRWDTMLRYGGAADESRVFLGTVPPWLTEPRVVLFSREGFALADGSRVPTLEAPVYAAPTGDGRLFYTVAVLAPDDGVDGFTTDVEATFAVGADGTVVPGQRCAGLTLDECAALLGPDVYEAVRAE